MTFMVFTILVQLASDSFNECLGLVCKWFIEYFKIDPLFRKCVESWNRAD